MGELVSHRSPQERAAIRACLLGKPVDAVYVDRGQTVAAHDVDHGKSECLDGIVRAALWAEGQADDELVGTWGTVTRSGQIG